MKMNLTVSLKGLDGKAILNESNYPVMLNQQLANMIVAEEAKENILQRYELAMKLNVAENEIEITESEKQIIKGVCEGGRVTVLFAAQVLGIINNAK